MARAVPAVPGVALAALVALAAPSAGCGRPEPAPAAPASPAAPAASPGATPAAPSGPAGVPAGAADASQEARLAAIQKAMNELDEAAQQCWAAAATERFDIAGDLALQIDIAPGTSHASVVRDTVHNPKLAACVVALLSAYPWAPPLHGQSIQLPFKFRAPDGQNTIDRTLVPWSGQGKVSVAVLLDESNSGNPAASMFELAIAAGGTTGMRSVDRTELWYFLGAGEVRTVGAGGPHRFAAGDMLYAPQGSAREIAAPSGSLHAVVVVVPGGREGAARAGALPTRELSATTTAGTAGTARAGRAGRAGQAGQAGPGAPIFLPASAARTYGPATLFADAGTIHATTLAASVLTLPAGGKVAEHAHADESELLYVLAGGGTMTVAGVELPVLPTSVVQIPRNTRHAFVATSEVRALQIYTPAGPEQRFKAHP
ncbi:MAG TPA: cupin domain-containing protein [Kofleriaceae bacterium]|nr:cupin domain-containing protein [Kofleriaceae bacterium]